jgi:hypothetical protein
MEGTGSDKVCSIEGCSKHVRARGLCGGHYERWRKTAPDDVKIKGGALCTISGCKRAAKSLGLCRMHYRQQYRKDPKVISRNKCSVSRCSKIVSARGWCTTHYMRWYVTAVGVRTRLSDESTLAYHRAHDRLKRTRGPASSYVCGCTATAREWAYMHNCPHEIQSALGPYSDNPACYKPMCSSCHKRMDRRIARME